MVFKDSPINQQALLYKILDDGLEVRSRILWYHLDDKMWHIGILIILTTECHHFA
jgi:hypothetical protein